MKHGGDVVSIVPASEGWRALYALSAEGTGALEPHEQPIAVWALIDEGKNGRYVAGFVADEYVDTAECEQFVRYLAPGEKAETFRDQLEATHRATNQRSPRLAS